MIVRKTVSIVSPSAQKCIDNFPPPGLLSVPRDKEPVARKTGCQLSPNLIITNSATLSHSPPSLELSVGDHFISDPSPRSDQRPAPNLFENRETSRVLDSHSFLLSLDPHEVSLNIDMKTIRQGKFSDYAQSQQ